MSNGRRRVRRTAVSLVSITALAAFVLGWQPAFAYDGLQRLFPRIVWRVATTQPLVALTFDDGPAPDHTPKVLEILARYGAQATFFLIGDRVVAHPETVEPSRSIAALPGILEAGRRKGLRFVTVGALLASR